MKMSFQIRLFISLIIVFLLLFSLFAVYYYLEAGRRIYQEVSVRTRVQSDLISVMPDLRRSVANSNLQEITDFMDKIVLLSDASFIVIGDNKINHLYHSVNKEKVGTPLIGGDNDEVLGGKTVTTWRRGGMGISLRSKSPVYDNNGNITGIVSVGYLKSELDNITFSKVFNAFIILFLMLVSLFIYSWFFTRSIKKQMSCLEPREIGLLVRQQKAMLESIYEGVIAVDDQLKVIVVNKAAQLLLGIKGEHNSLNGKNIHQLIKPVTFFDRTVMLENDTHDEICLFNQLTVIASRVRILLENKLQGWVITFRDRQEIESLTTRLSQVNGYLENLRIMHHEQLNQTAVISGLLQSGHYREAIDYIQLQSEHAQGVLDFISAQFASPMLCGLLLGKVSRAREKGIALVFDPGSHLLLPFRGLPESELISVIGNLLDNAIEATGHMDPSRRIIEVLILAGKDELIIEVADRGVGIPEMMVDRLFDREMTSKDGAEHGIGLYLVSSFVTQAGGVIEVTDNPGGGTVFSVFIPDIPEAQPDT
ncbi:sensor histidine kinase [Tatumella punctata]|uniref:histidine kinase n=1 Tax=Tatumella punctata TaxID=399969 RepID=A0ABW1VN05_9GAMM